MDPYWLNSALFGVGGVLVGSAIGYQLRGIHDLRKAHSVTETTTAPPTGPRGRRGFGATQIVGAVAMVMMLIALLVLVRISYEEKQTIACYNEAFRVRDLAGSQARQDFKAWMLADSRTLDTVIGNSPESPDQNPTLAQHHQILGALNERREATARYLASLDRVTEANRATFSPCA